MDSTTAPQTTGEHRGKCTGLYTSAQAEFASERFASKSLVLCLRPVESLRKSVLARVVVLALLAWTAVDLSDMTLCALDRESTPRHEASPDSCTLSSAKRDNSGSETRHIDDCFCCSHCVNASLVVSLVQDSSLLGLIRFASASHTRSAPHALYHPPQLLS